MNVTNIERGLARLRSRGRRWRKKEQWRRAVLFNFHLSSLASVEGCREFCPQYRSTPLSPVSALYSQIDRTDFSSVHRAVSVCSKPYESQQPSLPSSSPFTMEAQSLSNYRVGGGGGESVTFNSAQFTISIETHSIPTGYTLVESTLFP